MKEFLQKHRKRIIAGAVVICVLGGGTYYYMHSEGSKQTQNLYTTGKVEKGDVKQVLVLQVLLTLLIM